MPPRRKKKAEPRSRGLTATEVREGRPSAAASAKKFKAEGVKPEQLARAGGAAEQ